MNAAGKVLADAIEGCTIAAAVAIAVLVAAIVILAWRAA